MNISYIINAIKFVGLSCLLLLITACGGNTTDNEPPMPTEAAPAPLVVVIATETPIPEATATAVSDAETEEETETEEEQATMTTLVALNVRNAPSTAGEVVYVLEENTTVDIIGESDDGNWWEIICAVETVSECWASSNTEYSVSSNTDSVDSTEETAVSSTNSDSNTTTTTATATPTATATSAPTATSEPTATATTAAQTADNDNDSVSDPAMFTTFNPGTTSFSYSNDISYEGGDQEDWVAFEFPSNPNSNQKVWVTLTCTISGDSSAGIRATIYENQSSTSKYAACNGGEVELIVNNQNTQQVHIHFNDPKANTYVSYTLSVVGFR